MGNASQGRTEPTEKFRGTTQQKNVERMLILDEANMCHLVSVSFESPGILTARHLPPRVTHSLRSSCEHLEGEHFKLLNEFRICRICLVSAQMSLLVSGLPALSLCVSQNHGQPPRPRHLTFVEIAGGRTPLLRVYIIYRHVWLQVTMNN